MALAPFQWLGNQAVSSPEAAKRQRDIAKALMDRSNTPARNWAEGLGHITSALSGTMLRNRADEAEAAGREEIAAILAGLGPDSSFSDITSVFANPWAAGDPGTSAVAQALLGQNLKRNDPLYQLQLQTAQQGVDKGALELDALRNPAAPAPEYGFTFAPDGTLVRTDKTSGTIDQMGQFAQPEEQFRQIAPDEVAQRGLDPTKSWQVGPDGRVYEVGNSGVNVTTNVGGEGDPYQKKFWESMAAADAKSFTDAIETGDVARRNRINLDRLRQLSASTPQGLAGAVINTLGEFGIQTDGLDRVQAMESLISQLVPTQRPPGSGTISDADLRLYQASLPRLINTPEGNALILETMYAINDHDIAAAEIASRVAAGELTPAEARREMRALPNPFDDWSEKVEMIEGGDPIQPQANPSVFTPGQTMEIAPGISIRRVD